RAAEFLSTRGFAYRSFRRGTDARPAVMLYDMASSGFASGSRELRISMSRPWKVFSWRSFMGSDKARMDHRFQVFSKGLNFEPRCAIHLSRRIPQRGADSRSQIAAILRINCAAKHTVS